MNWASSGGCWAVNDVALTPKCKDTVAARMLLDNSDTLFLNGDPEVARLPLRDLVNATMGIEAVAQMTNKPAKSLHRMLSRSGNPSRDNLAAIIDAVRHRSKVGLKAQTVKAA